MGGKSVAKRGKAGAAGAGAAKRGVRSGSAKRAERAEQGVRGPVPPLVIALGVVAAVLVVALAVVTFAAPDGRQGGFEPPAFESAAQVGMPAEADVPAEMAFSEIYKDGMGFSAWLCGMPVVEDGQLVVWFANPEASGVWMKLRVQDAAGELLGETGLLRPSEYVRAVSLEGGVSPGAQLKLRIMAYEPETYYSAGSVGVNVTAG